MDEKTLKVYMNKEMPVGYDEEGEMRELEEEYGIKGDEIVSEMDGTGKATTSQMILPPLDSNGKAVMLPNRYNYKKRNAAERERDKVEIMKLYLEGATHLEISTALSNRDNVDYQLSTPMISKDIQEVLREWQITYLSDANKAKVRELLKLDHMEAELWEAWDKSKEDIIEKQQTVILGKNEIDSEAEDMETELEDAGYDENGVAKKIGRERVRDGKRVKADSDDGRERMRKVPNGGEAGSQSGVKSFTRSKMYEKRISSYGDIRIIDQIRQVLEMRAKILGLITTKSQVSVNWRKEAEKSGVNPDEALDLLTQSFIDQGLALGNGESGAFDVESRDMG